MITWTVPSAIPRRAPFAPHPSKPRRIQVNYRHSKCIPAAVFALLHFNHQMFPHRFGSREPNVFQLQPLQSPLPPATQVPQVSAACQRGEQGEESPGGPAAAGTGGKEEGVKFTLSQEGSILVFVAPFAIEPTYHYFSPLSNPILTFHHVTYHIKLHLHNI